ncbi:hypothetical protein CS0771_32130 [Catellatospora sp. IY07-71]|uniref:type I polyketide synthase n=1 Tax=Catellatospora sp. IY07-71 TaxID=2728827 RepID=UPI001BB4577F|nr:type I polyketide synthase [Catellatospora sp. IY07-71]BCJ73669.1 hypothetical protein CS0771_32130 [Catellatospora sp. IY07-71]
MTETMNAPATASAAPAGSGTLGESPIAIVGMGALFPKAGDVREYWGNIVDGVDCITDVPATHWRLDDYYDPDPTVPDKTYSRRGGFIPATAFHPLEYGIPPATLEVTGVLQLLSLVVAEQTLRDANCFDGGWYRPDRTGVVLGVTGPTSIVQPLVSRLQTPVLKEVVRSCGLTDRDADEIAAKFTKAFAPWQENSFPGMLGNVVAGRVANRFDLGGINCTVDAACASSLAALRMAVDELVSGRADLMLTGGVDAENTILMYLCFSKTPAFSRTDRIRPFDEDSDGTMIGEGLGMLALKRLADAERDGDRIYAVIRGLGSSSDGRFKSIYAPRREGQVTALRRAYADAGLTPADIGLIECHGTGTPVGDLTELSALRDVYTEAGAAAGTVAVGSVKSQIGHTKGAAGVAGVIKSALALHQKVLPPTINVTRPRAAAGFDDSPFYVNSRTRPWITQPGVDRRRAAVSSFGFGGTNFHCVLEEHPAADAAALHRTAQVRLWHAPTVPQLLDALRDDPYGTDPQDAVPAAHARIALVSRDDAERAALRETARQRLAAEPDLDRLDLNSGIHFRREGGVPGRVAALFAGQGSQYVGMGATAALALPPVRAAYDAAAAASDDGALGRVVFPPPAFDPQVSQEQEAALRATDRAQPAIGALSAGQYRYLHELGFRPDGALGHSFGELTALWAAGSVTDADFHRLAQARGRAMAQRPAELTDPGAMAALATDRERVEKLLVEHPDVLICNLNAPDQTVVGGGTAAVDEVLAACAEQGITARKVPVAAAFHTPYVAHAAEHWAQALAQTEPGEPAFPVYADTEGAVYGADPQANRDVLVGQLTSRVAFEPRLRQMYDEGFRVFVEFGPRSVLSGLVRATLGDHPDVVVLNADNGPRGDADRAVKQLAAQLAVLGMPLTGINRYTAPEIHQPTRKGLSVELDGMNHIPQQRRDEYQDALDNGYRVPAPQAAATDGAAPVAAAVTAVLAPVAPAASPAHLATLAGEHLTMHGHFLATQLQVAERIAALLQHEVANGPRESVMAGIAALTEHGIAISQSHGQASDVLRALAGAGDTLAVGQSAYVETDWPGAQPPTAAAAYVPPAPRLADRTAAAFAVPAPIHAAAPAATAPLNTTAPLNATAPAQATAPIDATAPAHLTGPGHPVAPATATAAAAATASADVANGAAPVQPAAETGGDVRGVLLEIVADKTGYPADMLDATMDIEADLGIDSIKRVEIMSTLANRFPDARTITPESLAATRTLDDIIAVVTAAQGGAPGEAGTSPKALAALSSSSGPAA